MTAHAIGGGGGGGGAEGNPGTGGGGKGGYYASVVITKGAETTLNVVVGAGGAGGTSANGQFAPYGDHSSVTQGGTTVLRGLGGAGGETTTANSVNGAGATGSGNPVNNTPVGTTQFVGGNGGTGNFTSGAQGSGAGGGAAGPSGNGGNASVNVAGTGNGANAGAGAPGVGDSTNGAAAPSAGPVYGGGGGGAKANTNANRAGGAGRQGVIWFVYTIPDLSTTPSETVGVTDFVRVGLNLATRRAETVGVTESARRVVSLPIRPAETVSVAESATADAVLPVPPFRRPMRTVTRSPVTVLAASGGTIADGAWSPAGNVFDHVWATPFARATVSLSAFAATPALYGTVELWGQMRHVDGALDDTQPPDGARFFGRWSVAQVNALQRRTIIISLAGCEQVVFYLRNRCGAAIDLTTAMTVKLTPFATGVRNA